VRVVLAHHLADDLRALDVLAAGLQAEFVHHVQNTAVNGLEAVAYVGQGAHDDHRHGVVEIRRAHLLLEPAGLDVAAVDCVDRRHRLHVQVGHQARVLFDEGATRLD